MSLRRYRCLDCEETFYALTFTPRCQNCTPVEEEAEEVVEEPKEAKRKRSPRRETK
jgi:transposase-like protein